MDTVCEPHDFSVEQLMTACQATSKEVECFLLGWQGE